MSSIRLTAAEAVVRFLAAQQVDVPEGPAPLFGGVFAIFGHGNVAGLGEALQRHREALPTYRAHNEQAMAHAAIAYAKAHLRRRMMAVTTSIGPGATNLVTAAATALVNRLPLLLLPGDVFASRAPDPVLQQVEGFEDGTVSANDCLRPVSRYFDRIQRPEQLLAALPRALQALTDPAACGPATLALPQDVQAMALDWPAELFEPRVVRFRSPPPAEEELAPAAAALRRSRRPVTVAGGGVLYGLAAETLRAFAEAHGAPVCETQAGKGALPWDHPLQLGAAGVTGSPAASELLREADLVLAVGTRLSDFTTGSHALFPQAALVGLNVNGLDARKWHGEPLQADARLGLEALGARLGDWSADASWSARARKAAAAWRDQAGAIQDFTRAIALNPKLRDAYANRALAYSLMHEYESAISDLRRTLELKPQDPENHKFLVAMGSALDGLGRRREAIAQYDEAIRATPGGDPRLPGYYLQRSFVWAALGEKGRAMADAREALARGAQVDPAYLRELAR